MGIAMNLRIVIILASAIAFVTFASICRAATPESGEKLLWGYIDKDGKYIVKPQFKFAQSMCEGRAVVETTAGRWGFIDNKGKFAIDPKFESACSFIDGRAQVKVGGKWGYIDRSGKFVVEPQNDEWMPPACSQMLYPEWGSGLSRKQVGKKWGYENKKGKLVIPARYANAFGFGDGVAPVAVPEQEAKLINLQ